MNVLNLEECDKLGDSKYRAYVAQVDKALRAFEYTSEWADLISALGKLNKVLSSHIRYPVIPKRVTIGKRLAQCLHPALPSGVHLKVLETYDIIFKCIGTTRLASDLFTYGSGLFPLMGYAAMNVRPVLLQLYETHFVALQKHIKPALTGLIMGLLPGLEEGSEHFSRTAQLLEEFCEAAEPPFFYGCLWECVLASATNRLAGINFVLAHFNRKQSMEDQLFFMGTNLDILVKGLCVALQDSSILVQRSTLDLLIVCFPIYNSQLPKSDMIKLLTAAIRVVLRRDMSLNRRLYAWLIGCDSNGLPLAITTVGGPANEGGRVERQDSTSTNISEMDYFNTYSKDLLIVAVRNSLLESSDTESGLDGRSVNLKPFKILMSLLDKPEIGSAILEDILMEIFRCMYRECVTKAANVCRSGSRKEITTGADPEDIHLASKADDRGGINSEIVKTANLLFGAFEPYFIWNFISRGFRDACRNAPKVRGGAFGKGDVSVTELCLLVDFLLDKLSVEAYKETQTEHLPRLLQCLLSSLTEYIDQMTDNELLLCLNICSKILSRVQPSVTLVGASDIDNNFLKKQRRGSTTSDNIKEKDIETDLQDAPHQQLNEGVDKGCVTSEADNGDVLKKSLNDADENSLCDASGSGRDSNVRGVDSEFCDFIQFENSEQLTVDDTKGKNAQTNLQNCIEYFVKFFEAFLTKCLLVSYNHSKIQPFLSRVNCTETSQSADINDFLTSDCADGMKNVNRLPLGLLSLKLCQAFASACQLLVEFSSLPIFCTSNYKTIKKSFQQVSDFSFPNWLQLLLTCACAVKNFSIESAAISAILDLIGLTRSFIAEVERKGGSQNIQDYAGDLEDRSSGDNTVSVLILPLLTPNDLAYMNKKTNFYQLVANNLWQYLDDATPEYHSRAVEHLYQLQQLSPDPWTCEDVISSALLSENKTTKFAAHRKFAIFWHLLRDRTTATLRILPVRTFDRSLLVMLDSLLSDVHLSSSLTQTWLLHAVQHGDLMRILEPLLLILLHPDTARVSIQHVNIHKPRRLRISMSEKSDESGGGGGGGGGGGDVVETSIFAISSEGGNVIYHISNNGKSFSRKVSEELRTYALTFVSEKGPATKASRTNLETDLVYMQVDPSDVNLTVNPFGSQQSLDSEVFENSTSKPSQLRAVQNAKRLTKTTCEKERIFFDDNEQETLATSQDSENMSSAEDVSSEMIVLSILDKVIDEVLACPSTASTMNASDTIGSVDENQLRDERSPSKDKTVGLDFDEDLFAHNSHISDIDSQSDGGMNTVRSNSFSRHEELPNVHPLHTHVLLYMQKYDARRTLYALTCLKSVIATSPHLITVALTTSNIGSSTTPHVTQVLNLLIRHRRSVFGKNFNSELPADASLGVRSSMFVEVLISVCLFYIRGYYPNLMMSKLSELELNANKEIQILSSDILTMIFSELTFVAYSSGRGVATYIGELLLKCKVQKALLYSLIASVYNSRFHGTGQEETIDISEAIINFNNEYMDADANETLQIKLIKLLLSVIMLEDQIQRSKGDIGSRIALPPEYENTNLNAPLSTVRYLGGVPVVYQPMLLAAIINMLRQQHMCHMHRHWVMMAISAMPFLGRALTKIVLATVNQICRNLELLAQLFELGHVFKSLTYQPDQIPPDHVVTLLEGLTTICHYCLLDTNQQDVNVVGVLGQSLLASATGTGSTATAAAASDVHGGLLFNLTHVFQLGSSNREISPSKEVLAASNPRLEARSHLLNILPWILASLAVLWKAIHVSEKKEQQGKTQPWWSLGTPKMIRHCILEMLSPVALHHAQHMMAAVAVVWNERRQRGPPSVKKVIPVAADDQLILVDLVSMVKLLPLDTIIQTVKQIIRQPGETAADTIRKRVPLEVGLLRFLYAYIQRVDGSVLADTWPLLLSLFKEGLQINLVPPGQFILLSILSEFLQKIAMFEERKDQKDLQEITQKLLEACSEIAGSSLEQVTFFRRNLAVKPGKQIDVSEMDELTTDVEIEGPQLPNPAPAKPSAQVTAAVHAGGTNNQHQYSVQALILLSEVTATLLDVVYCSEEKERVIPLLNSILYNVFPYLKNHSSHNLPSYRACSQMLSSLSSYQYTRKTWKKEAFDLLLDNNFFQMDEQCIRSWMTTVDNLMTHDRGSSFRDLLIRVNATQSSSLNLFGSREAEFEQRAQLLKRLAFTIFCSEVDQYQKLMPDIQEKLADCLRVPSVLPLQAQVFLCFRVLILRISPQYLTSLWPTIITELVHVMLQIEQDLAPETEVIDSCRLTSKHRYLMRNQFSRLDASWTTGNGMVNLGNSAWLHLYVSACKLLDLCLTLPADLLPQFQLYRWAFVADPSGLPQDNEKRKIRDQPPSFVPHVIRIARLMKSKFGDVPLLPQAVQRPLLTTPRICSMQDLCSFFVTIYSMLQDGTIAASTAPEAPSPSVTSPQIQRSHSVPNFNSANPQMAAFSISNSPVTPTQFIEQIIIRDFLDPLPSH